MGNPGKKNDSSLSFSYNLFVNLKLFWNYVLKEKLTIAQPIQRELYNVLEYFFSVFYMNFYVVKIVSHTILYPTVSFNMVTETFSMCYYKHFINIVFSGHIMLHWEVVLKLILTIAGQYSSWIAFRLFSFLKKIINHTAMKIFDNKIFCLLVLGWISRKGIMKDMNILKWLICATLLFQKHFSKIIIASSGTEC